MPAEKDNLFKIFSQNESKIAQLYALYALAIPSQEKMWTRLSGEEIKHAMVLQKLDTVYGDSEKLYTAIEGARNILDYVGNFIDEQLAAAQSRDINVQEAISTAMRLEQSMIERKCFDIVSSNEPEIISILETLNKETENHFQILKMHINDSEIY